MAVRKANKGVDIKISADIREALRNVAELQRQANKLGDLADQSQKRQGGFLSPKQVDMYRNIVKEVQKTYGDHYAKLSDMQAKYDKMVQKSQAEVAKRQEALNRAQGANKWGDVSTPKIVEHLERRVTEAQVVPEEQKALKTEISRMTGVVGELESEVSRAQAHSQRIASMTELNPRTKSLAYGAANAMTSVGGVTSFGALLNYLGNSKDAIRQREGLARDVAQSGKWQGSDLDIAESLERIGMGNGYNASQTAAFAQALAQYGTQDQNRNQADVYSTQEFTRNFSMDPDALVSGFGLLRKMGTLEEGQMKYFATLIAGSVKTAGMTGREEEATRATNMLLSSVSQNLTEMSTQSVSSIVGLQTLLGNAIPSLKGEKGAEVLGGIDAAIKTTGNPNADVVLGWGTKFQGMEGAYDLRMQKEEGIANPENLKSALKFFESYYPDQPEQQQMALISWLENLGVKSMSLHQSKEFMDSGAWGKVVRGETLSESELFDYGLKENTEREQTYKPSDTSVRRQNDAAVEARQAAVGDEYEGAATSIMEQFNNLSQGQQKAAIFGGGLLGGTILWKSKGLLTKGILGGIKKIKPGIGGSISNVPTVSPPVTPTIPTTPVTPPTTPTLLGPNGQPISSTPSAGTPSSTGSIAGAAEEAAETAAKGAGRFGKALKGVGKFGGKLLGGLGWLSTADTVDKWSYSASDWFWGHEKGQPYSKPGIAKNPFKIQTYEEDRAGIFERLYNKANGIEPANVMDETEVNKSSQKTTVNPILGGAKFITAEDIVNGKNVVDAEKLKDALQRPWQTMWNNALDEFSTKVEETQPKITAEQTIRVIVQGRIDGVTPSTETKLLDAFDTTLKDQFKNNTFGLNLSIDQTRK